jgi:hypothetical protein
VSLFALIPGHKIGPASLAVAIGGLIFVTASLLSLIRLRQVRWGTVRDAVFLPGLIATFVVQLVEAADVIAKPRNPGTVNTIASLVIVCFLIGIARAWELIGGPRSVSGERSPRSSRTTIAVRTIGRAKSRLPPLPLEPRPDHEYQHRRHEDHDPPRRPGPSARSLMIALGPPQAPLRP